MSVDLDVYESLAKADGLELIHQPVLLAERSESGHKGTFGHTLLIAGSEGMTGAAILSGKAALRSGTGLVSIATDEQSRLAIVIAEPALMTRRLPTSAAARFRFLDDLQKISAVGIGPGLGMSSTANELTHLLYQNYDAPVVIDADGLNLLSQHGEQGWPAGRAGHIRILTPHPGEFSRMTGLTPDELSTPQARVKHAVQFARTHQVIVVLKGHQTLVTDGNQLVVNQTGNSGLATGGTGDVLTGLLSGLVAQGEDPFLCAALACHLHGLAADLAVEELSPWGLTSTELIHWLPAAFKAHAKHGLRKRTEN